MSWQYPTQMIQGMLYKACCEHAGTCIFRSPCRPCCSSTAHLSRPDELPKMKLSQHISTQQVHLTTLLPEIHQGLALQLVNASNQFLLGIENGCNPQTMHCAQIWYCSWFISMGKYWRNDPQWGGLLSTNLGPSEINPSQQNGDVIDAWNFFRIFLTVTSCNLDQFGSHNISQEYVFFFSSCSPSVHPFSMAISGYPVAPHWPMSLVLESLPKAKTPGASRAGRAGRAPSAALQLGEGQGWQLLQDLTQT